MVDSEVHDGVFKMSLDAYLRAFSDHEIGRVKDTMPCPSSGSC